MDPNAGLAVLDYWWACNRLYKWYVSLTLLTGRKAATIELVANLASNKHCTQNTFLIVNKHTVLRNLVSTYRLIAFFALQALQDFLQVVNMYPGFFVHSPKADHSLHLSSPSMQSPHLAFWAAALSPNGPTCIHLVADHFSPLVVAQLPCKLLGSTSPSGFRLQHIHAHSADAVREKEQVQYAHSSNRL